MYYNSEDSGKNQTSSLQPFDVTFNFFILCRSSEQNPQLIKQNVDLPENNLKET
jgi:hypothetical protein